MLKNNTRGQNIALKVAKNKIIGFGANLNFEKNDPFICTRKQKITRGKVAAKKYTNRAHLNFVSFLINENNYLLGTL